MDWILNPANGLVAVLLLVSGWGTLWLLSMMGSPASERHAALVFMSYGYSVSGLYMAAVISGGHCNSFLPPFECTGGFFYNAGHTLEKVSIVVVTVLAVVTIVYWLFGPPLRLPRSTEHVKRL